MPTRTFPRLSVHTLRTSKIDRRNWETPQMREGGHLIGWFNGMEIHWPTGLLKWILTVRRKPQTKKHKTWDGVYFSRM